MPARLTVIAGPMFSGKSDELIRRVRRAGYARKEYLALKPKLDDRHSANEVVTRRIDENGHSVIVDRIPATPIANEQDFERALRGVAPFQVLAVDEAQFFDDWIDRSILQLMQGRVEDDLEIVISGLDMDAQARPFGAMPRLLAHAENVLKLHAACFMCGKPAPLTKRTDTSSRKQIQVGDVGLYEARCRPCHRLP